MMGQGPALDHHQPHQHLAVAGLAFTAVAVGGQRGPMPFEIARGQIVEDQIHLQVEQVPQAQKQLLLDPSLGRYQSIQGAIPLFELPILDPYPRPTAGQPFGFVPPLGEPASALPIANKVRFQPARQAVLAGRLSQAIGHQGPGPIRQLGIGTDAVQDGLQAQLPPQGPRHQQRPPVPSPHGLSLGQPHGGLPLEQAQQGFGMGGQDVFAPQITDDAVAGTALIPIGFDQADVFVDPSIGAFDSGGPEKHLVLLSDVDKIA